MTAADGNYKYYTTETEIKYHEKALFYSSSDSWRRAESTDIIRPGRRLDITRKLLSIPVLTHVLSALSACTGLYLNTQKVIYREAVLLGVSWKFSRFFATVILILPQSHSYPFAPIWRTYHTLYSPLKF